MEMKNRTVVSFIIIALAVGIGLVIVLGQGGQSGSKQPTKVAAPSPASVVGPVAISQFRGTVDSVSPTGLVATSEDGKKQTFALSPKVDLQRLISGTLEGGNARTEKIKVSDIKPGSDVLVVLKKTSGEVQAVLVIE